MPKIVSCTKRVDELTPSEKATMLGLLSIEFLGVSREDFIKDLAEKDVAMLLRNDDGEGDIVGFSTLMVLDISVEGKSVKAIFSGDTTVLEQWRCSQGFGVEIGRYFMKTVAAFPDHEIYYILISKGWRTYKVLPFFFRHFAPKYGMDVSTHDQAVIDAFGRTKYPQDYDPEHGLIMFSRETQRLVPGSSDALPPSQPNAHIEFFLMKNPTYLSGTELVCVAPVHVANFTPAMLRLLKSSER